VRSTFLAGVKGSSDATVVGGDPRWAYLRGGLDRLPLRLARAPAQPYRSAALVGVRLSSLCAAHPAELLHLHWINAGFLRPETLPSAALPLVWTLHDEWPFAGAEHYCGETEWFRRGYPPGVDRWLFERKKRAYARLDRLTLIAPSRWMAERARQSLLLADRRIEVIPYCVDTALYRPRDRAEARAALGLPATGPLVLFVGDTGDPRKGFRHLLRALERLPGVLLAVAGPSTQPGNFQALGMIHDEERLANAYCAADVLACPSLEDNLPCTVIEALSCGTPSVAFAVGGLPDLIQEGVTGALARPFDAADLARALSAAIDAGAPLRTSARRQAEAAFSGEAVAQAHLALYQSLVDA